MSKELHQLPQLDVGHMKISFYGAHGNKWLHVKRVASYGLGRGWVEG